MKKIVLLLSILALALGLYSAALNEGFESTTCPADGWTITYANSSYPLGNTMTHSTTNYHSGSRSFRFSSYANGSPYDQYLITPELSVTDGDQTVSFWYRSHSSYGDETFHVGWSSTGTATTDFTWSDEMTGTLSWQQYQKTDLPVGTKYVALHYTSDFQYYLYIDDFAGPEVYAAAGTPDPASNPSPADQALNVSLNGNLTWDFGVDTDAYDLWFGPIGSMVQVEDGTTAGESGSYAYTGLTNDTQYSWRVDTINNTSGITTTGSEWTFTTALPAGMVKIGYDSLTTLNLPLNPFYGYNFSQTIYLQTEIAISGQRIEKLYYYWNGLAAGTNTKNWTVYMAHTTKTAFSSTTDWVPYADFTEVFRGIVTLPASPGWVEITLLTPFTYNNVDNLVIAINENTPGDDGNSAKFLGTTFAANRGLRLQNDSSAYNPASPGTGTLVAGIANIKLQFGDIPTVPSFAYNPTSLTFANTLNGTSSEWQNVTVSNLGQGTLNLYSTDLSLIGTDASEFEFDASNLPAELTAGQSETIPVRFNAPAVGSYSATLRMTYDSVAYDVALSGSSVYPFVNMTTGSTTLAEGECWNFYDSGGVAGQYGSSENDTYTFNPPAGYRCIVEFSAFNTESGWDFLKLYDGTDATGTLIGDYSGTSVPDSYSSLITGSLTFVFTSDGSGVRDGWAAAISSELLPVVPILSHSPAALAFPLTKAGESSAAQDVTITNIGGGTLLNADIRFSLSGSDTADFSYNTTNLQDLETGQSFTVPVSFIPQSAGDKSATLVITYDSEDYEAALTGSAYPATYVFEGFEGSFPPAGWANPGSWSKNTYTYYAGTSSAYKYSSSSSPYILSTPKLDLNSGDVLSFMGRVSSTSATLDIIYSQNGTDWTVLETLSAPTANTWLPVSVDLSPILSAKAGEGYYLGFRTMSSASYYIDNVVMPPFIQEAPEVVTLTAPVDSATNVGTLPTFTWTASATGGVPTGYNIYLDDVDGSTLYASDVSSPYTLETPLAYNTPYYWTVEAYNGILVGPKATVQTFTTMDDPTVTPPFTEGFEAGNTHNTAIVGWTQETVSGTNVWTANTSYTDYNRTPRTDSWNAFLRWGSTRWMFKPVNVTAETTYRVVVYARQDGATAANASIGISYGATDNAAAMTNVILASTGIINGDYQRLEGTFTPDATGVRYIGILGTINSSPYYISIDDITIAEVSDTPTFAISPTEKDYGTVNLGTSASQIFTISNSGGGTLTIEKEAITLTGDNTSEFNLSPIAEDISLTTSQTAQITVTFSPNSVGAKTAYLQIVDNTAEEKTGMKSGSKATHNIALNGTGFDATIHDFPFSESFETQFPPENWTNSDWEWSLYGDFHTGEEWAYCNLSGASLDTPPFALPEASELEFSFWYRAEGDGHPQDMNVLMSVDGTPQGSPIISISEATNTTYQKAAFDLASYAGHNVAFSFVGLSGTGGYSWGICVDDVAVKAYDYPAGTPVIIGDDTVTVTGGSANNVPGGDIPEIPNTAFVPVGSFVLQLVGAGPWTVTIETDALWGAYYQGGEWHEVQASEGVISFVVTASKDAEVPIVLGDLDPTLSVTLATFTAVLTADLHVQIAWMSESETDHAGYNLLRSEVQELSTAMRINDTMINEGIATGTQMSYIYTDTQVYHDATYYYWLESVSLSGETEYYGPITVYVNANGEGPGIPEIPLETKLYSAFPNPFNPSTNLRYSMKEAGDVRIDVYNLKGQILKTFHNSHNLPGYYQVNWDGRDMNGRVVGTGVYFYRMTSGQYSATRKMVLAKQDPDSGQF